MSEQEFTQVNLGRLNINVWHKEVQKAINSAAAELKKRVKKDIGSRTYPDVNSKNPDSLLDAVRIGRWQTSEDNVRSVHLLGSRKKGSQTYKLRFFIGQDKERKDRGVLKSIGEPLEKAVGEVKVTEIIRERLAELLNKINQSG